MMGRKPAERYSADIDLRQLEETGDEPKQR
jgi:hypothetical protein